LQTKKRIENKTNKVRAAEYSIVLLIDCTIKSVPRRCRHYRCTWYRYVL